MGQARPRHSSRDRSFRHLLDDLQALDLLVAEDDVPDGIGGGAHAVGGAEAKTICLPPHQLQALIARGGHRFYPLVELHPVLDPLIVQSLGGLVKHHLQGREVAFVPASDLKRVPPRPDFQKPRQYLHM